MPRKSGRDRRDGWAHRDDGGQEYVLEPACVLVNGEPAGGTDPAGLDGTAAAARVYVVVVVCPSRRPFADPHSFCSNINNDYYCFNVFR